MRCRLPLAEMSGIAAAAAVATAETAVTAAPPVRIARLKEAPDVVSTVAAWSFDEFRAEWVDEGFTTVDAVTASLREADAVADRCALQSWAPMRVLLSLGWWYAALAPLCTADFVARCVS